MDTTHRPTLTPSPPTRPPAHSPIPPPPPPPPPTHPTQDDASTKFAALDIRQCKELIDEGVIAGGMIPKVLPGCCCMVLHGYCQL